MKYKDQIKNKTLDEFTEEEIEREEE